MKRIQEVFRKIHKSTIKYFMRHTQVIQKTRAKKYIPKYTVNVSLRDPFLQFFGVFMFWNIEFRGLKRLDVDNLSLWSERRWF